MRRPLYSRVFSLALSLWLPLFMSGAESVVHCPTHSGSAPVASATHAATAATTPAEHDHGPCAGRGIGNHTDEDEPSAR